MPPEEEEAKEEEAPQEQERDVEKADAEFGESLTEHEEFDEAGVVDPAAAHAEEEEADEAEEGENKSKKKYVMKVAADAPWRERMWEVFTTFWPLGLVAFGGPQAHVALLRDHLVEQRDWLDDDQFTELFAIGQVSNNAAYQFSLPASLNLIRISFSHNKTGFAWANEYTARHFDSH